MRLGRGHYMIWYGTVLYNLHTKKKTNTEDIIAAYNSGFQDISIKLDTLLA